MKRLEGRDAIAAYMGGLQEHIIFGTFENVRVWPSGDDVIMEADGHHRRPDGTPVDIRYVSILEFRDGLIQRYTDYMGPIPS